MKAVDCPDVSVVLLAYNHEQFISDAVESIVGQDFDGTWEVLIADDASTDATAERARDAATGAPWVRLLDTPVNLGMQRNLRHALETAKGRYVALLEGDDRWTDRQKLQRQFDLLESHPEFAAAGHLTEVLEVDDDGGETAAGWFCQGFAGAEELSFADVMTGVFPHASSLMYRRDLLSTTPAWFTGLHAADWAVCGLLAQQGGIGILQEPMSAYRKNSASTWTPRPHLERKVIALENMVVFGRHMAVDDAAFNAEVARAHIRVASIAARERRARLSAHHLRKAVTTSPGVPVAWLKGAVRRRTSLRGRSGPS